MNFSQLLKNFGFVVLGLVVGSVLVLVEYIPIYISVNLKTLSSRFEEEKKNNNNSVTSSYMLYLPNSNFFLSSCFAKLNMQCCKKESKNTI